MPDVTEAFTLEQELEFGCSIPAIGSIPNRECGSGLGEMASATDTNFGAPNEFGITGGNSPTAR